MIVTASDCRQCGACCADGRLVAITPRDRKRLGPGVRVDVAGVNKGARDQVKYAVTRYGQVSDRLQVALGLFDGIALMPKARRGHRCARLRGRLGSEVACDVYDRRPEMCREQKPGSPGCLKSRAQFKIKESKK